MLIDGIHIPLTMPFTRDGESYLRKLEYNVRRYSLGPAAGFVALTAEFEGGSLSDEETRDVLQVIGASAAAEKVLVVAIARNGVRPSLAVAAQAAEAGFDVVLLTAPRGEELSEDERLVYLRSVADASPLPVMLGSATGDSLPLDAIAELARHRNILGLYDDALTLERYNAIAGATKSVQHEVTVTTIFTPVTGRMLAAGGMNSGDLTSFVKAESLAGGMAVAVTPSTAIKTRRKTVGFQILSAGSAQGLTELLEAGAAGAMLTLSACAPQGCHEAYAAFKDGNPALAFEKGQRLIKADAAILALRIAGVKYGCDWNGFYGGAPRLPRLPLRIEERETVERVLSEIRN